MLIPLLFSMVMSVSLPEINDQIWVEDVENKIVIGDLTGNRNLEFGVKNILEEALMEMDYDLHPDASKRLKVEIIFLDVITTNRNISVFSKRSEAVVIRLRGFLIDNGEIVKEKVAEESSAEISMATLVIDGGGQFNQTSLSNALKKACESLIKNLMG